MQDKDRAEKIWAGLNDDQRGALQALLGSGGKMPATMYARLFGDIPRLGADQMLKAAQNPQSSTEALYFKGLIAQAFEKSDAGARPIIYIPDDLVAVLPTHKTAYENLESVPASERPEMGALEEVDNIIQADTSIVDDLTTVLAYLQLHGALVVDEDFVAADRDALLPHLLDQDESRLAFLLGMGISADLIVVDEGKASPKRAETRIWLSESRSNQVKALADAWRGSTAFRELPHVPGLNPEALPNYDPTIARGRRFVCG
jgi:hypothetical protein